MELVPLGTGSATPTRTRHLAAFALRHGGDVLLFDCGEGTQRRLLTAGLSGARLKAVFITHLHGDHFFGLFGLLTTMALLGRTEPLLLVGPAPLEGILRAMPGLGPGQHAYELRFVGLADEVAHAVVMETPSYRVEARPLEHRVPTFGYRVAARARPGGLDVEAARAAGVTYGPHFAAIKRGESVTLADGRVVRPDGLVGPERPGATFAYVSDTKPCEGGRLLGQNADLLVHEATFLHERLGRAVETGHSTARQAAEVARDAGARALLLTHFSSRYTDPAPLVAEARAVFPNSAAAVELRPYVVSASGLFLRPSDADEALE